MKKCIFLELFRMKKWSDSMIKVPQENNLQKGGGPYFLKQKGVGVF